ncbi:MAG TPA: hypothetical protein VNQ48_05150 [Microbacteriaceae bacterium]|nr:hypothetical protein [Microbacteriaceae bacterium]
MNEPHEWGPGVIVGGYRLLRRLGSGVSAEVWLAASAVAEDGERVALKLIRVGAGPERAAREAEALWRARGPHVVRLREVVPLASGTPFLMLDVVPHELGAVLGGGLSLGAVVTVLVPLAQELARLHALGVTHGGVRLAAVGLDERGSPVLLGFGAAQIGPPDVARRATDCAGLAALALVVLSAVPEEDRSDSWHRLVAWLGASQPGKERWLDALVERVYDLAEPEPIALQRAESLDAVVLAAAADARGSRMAVRDAAPTPRGGDAAVAWLRAHVSRLTRLGRVRARFWVPAAVAAVGLALVLLPTAAGGSADAVVSSSSPAPTSPSTSEPVPQVEPAPKLPSIPPPRPNPTPTATVLDELGGAVIVLVDGPRGPEQLVLVTGPDGWQVRAQLPADPGADGAGAGTSAPDP